MRRFGLLVLALVLMLNWQRLGTRQVRQVDPGQAKGIVTNIIKKKRTTYYYMGGVLAVDFSGKDRGLHVGDRVCMTGKYKDLDDLKIKDFDYGRHLRSKGIDTYIELSSTHLYGRSGI